MADRDETKLGGMIHQSGKDGVFTSAVQPERLHNPAAPNERDKNSLRGRKTKLSCFGISKDLLAAGDPRYRAALTQANKYRKLRQRELADLHGHVSTGAGAMLASASLALAASRYLYERAAETGDLALLKQAASLADSSRQHELAAYELAQREGVLAKRQKLAKEGMPWLQTVDGDDRVKTGRKTNEQRAVALLEEGES